MKLNLQAIKNLKIILFFLGVTLFYFWDYLFLGKTLFSSHFGYDFLGYDFPLSFTAISFLKRGIFPLWNPRLMCGTPLFVAPVTVLSIFNIPCLLSLKISAFMFSMLMQVFCAGILMFYYLNKGLHLGRHPSFLGAVIFVFNPAFLLMLQHFCAESTAVLWFPLTLLFYEMSVQKRNTVYVLLTGLTLSISLYSGIGYIYLFSCLFLFLYGLFRIYQVSENKKELMRNFLFLIMAILLSILLSSLHLIPFAEAMKLSHRGGEHHIEGLFLSNLIGIFFPFGSIRIGQVEIGTLKNAYFYYAGTATVFLVLSLWYIRRDHFVRLFSSLGLGMITFLILLRYTPLKLSISQVFPFFGTFALERINQFYYFWIAGMAALGYDAIGKKRIKHNHLLFIEKVFKLFIVTYFIMLVLFSFAWIGKNIFKEQVSLIFQTAFSHLLLGKLSYIRDTGYYLKKFSYIYDQLFLPSFAILIVIVIASRILSLVFLSKIFRNKKVSLVLIFLVYIDLISLNRLFINPFSYDYYKIYESKSKEVVFLKTMKPTERMGIKLNYYVRDLAKVDFKSDYDNEPVDLGPYNLGLNYNIPIVFGVSTIGGRDAMYPKRFREFIDLVHRNDPNYTIRCNTPPDKDKHNIEFTSIDSRLIDLLGMKYILSSASLADPKLKLLFKGKDYYVYENLEVLPRSFLVNNIKIALTKEEVFNLLSDDKFDPYKEVILEEHLKHPLISLSKDNSTARSLVNIIDYQPNKVVISASSDKDSLLLLTDTYYPGWKAFIDEKQTKIYAADYIFRAIFFPQGTHTVEFVYNPFSFRLGLWISLVTLAVVLSIVLYKMNRSILKNS